MSNELATCYSGLKMLQYHLLKLITTTRMIACLQKYSLGSFLQICLKQIGRFSIRYGRISLPRHKRLEKKLARLNKLIQTTEKCENKTSRYSTSSFIKFLRNQHRILFF